jgi:hypothetical protein
LKRWLAAAALLAGCSGAPLESDWERAHREVVQAEDAVQLPAYPRASDLVEFSVPDARGFRFFLDASSLSVGRDGVIRYSFIGRSPAGAENVSFEGLRCRTGEYRVYAIGRPEARSWSAAPGQWQAVSTAGTGRWRAALRTDYFCREPVRDADDALQRVRQGGWRPGSF